MHARSVLLYLKVLMKTWTTCKYVTIGNLTGEHWLRLINMHRLTASAPQELRVDLEDFQINTHYARYTTFTVGNATTTDYHLLVSGYSGTAGNGMSTGSGRNFSTKGRDNDLHSVHCAVHHNSPWWHRTCTTANLNGKYYHVETTAEDTIYWHQWHEGTSMKAASMKIRRK